MQVPYWVVDAFADRLFAGNPAAVVLPAATLSDAVMLAVAAENNLSETAFAVPEGDGWRLRWFTPTMEVDLCGHATLAASFVLASEGHAGPWRYHTRSGVLTAATSGAGIELDFPARRSEVVAAPEGLAEALGVQPMAVLRAADLIAVLADPTQVAGLRPDIAGVAALPGGTVIVTAAGGDGVDVTSRFFAPGYGIPEDPVTGALHTQVVPYWAARLGRDTLVCRQASARGGTLLCTLAGDRVRMRGTAMLYAKGHLWLPDVDG